MEEAFNPWNVQSLEAFHVYCCPECDSKHMTKSDFIGHAMFQHPRARQFVPAIIQNTTPNVPQPPQQQVENRNNYPLVQNFKQEFPQARTTVNLPITNNFSCDLSYMTPVVTIHQSSPKKSKVKYHQSIKSEPSPSYESHSSKKKLHVCDICDKVLSSSCILARHKKLMHTQTQQKEHKCVQCHKAFFAKSDLKRHFLSVHQGVTFKCKQCDKELNSKDSLLRHEKYVHSNGDAKVYNCDRCTYSTIYKQCFQRHIKNRHFFEAVS